MNYIIKNPFSGVRSMLNEEQKDALIQIKTLEYQIFSSNDKTTNNTQREADIKLFDKLMMEFRMKWRQLYYEQLD